LASPEGVNLVVLLNRYQSWGSSFCWFRGPLKPRK